MISPTGVTYFEAWLVTNVTPIVRTLPDLPLVPALGAIRLLSLPSSFATNQTIDILKYHTYNKISTSQSLISQVKLSYLTMVKRITGTNGKNLIPDIVVDASNVVAMIATGPYQFVVPDIGNGADGASGYSGFSGVSGY